MTFVDPRSVDVGNFGPHKNVHAHCEKHVKAYRTRLAAHSSTRADFEKNVTMFKARRVPNAIKQQAHLQFKKEAMQDMEEYKTILERRSLQDL